MALEDAASATLVCQDAGDSHQARRGAPPLGKARPWRGARWAGAGCRCLARHEAGRGRHRRGRLGRVHAGGSDVHPCVVCLLMLFKTLAISFSTMTLFTGVMTLYRG